MGNNKIVVKIANEEERKKIYRFRHDIYAKELHQHKENEENKLTDDLDNFNTYIIVKIEGKIAGFVSITPPNGKYGLDKYISRDKYPHIYDNMYEGRLFSVLKEYRGGPVALLLFFAVLRFAETHKGDKIMTIGRIDLVDFYKKTGLMDLGEVIKSGEATFKLMYASIKDIREKGGYLEKVLRKILPNIDNQLPFSLIKEVKCYHGGEFFNAIGPDFMNLEKSKQVINADVLDAWFDPSPKVTEALTQFLPWILKTSPPTQCEGLIKTIAEVRGVPDNSILTGGGSSDLMYLALTRFLNHKSKVLLLDPTYGEYRFIIDNVIGCKSEAFILQKENQYRLNIDMLMNTLNSGHFDMLFLVNPNNPTGKSLSKEEIRYIAENISKETFLWIDETYIEYAGATNSFEQYAPKMKNVIICKSMSKVYALSGVRCAYLISNTEIIDTLTVLSPPWAVSLPAQIAGTHALKDPEYYEKCYKKTHENRETLIENLKKLKNVHITDGIINSVLCEFPHDINIKLLVKECSKKNLFIRDIKSMGQNLNMNAVRITVKDEEKNIQIVNILREVCSYN